MTHAPRNCADPHHSDTPVSPSFSVQATPLVWVWTTVVAGLLFFVLQTTLAVSVPTLGVDLESKGNNSGLNVTRVYAGLPADLAGLKVGDVMVAVTGAEEVITLLDHLTLDDPDVDGSYTTLNIFQKDIRDLSRLMANGVVVVSLEDGRSLTIQAQPNRPLGMLPAWYWAVSLMGIVALAIGVALKAHRPEDSNTTQVLVAAFGFWLTAWSWPLYGPRELAAPLPHLIAVLESINHLGFVIMIGAALALLWQYPLRLGPGRILPLTLGVGLLIWAVMSFQLYEFPLHAFYFPLFCMPLVIAITLAITQWKLSKDRPLEKASLRWLLISMFGSTCGAFAMYVVPPMYGAEPFTSPWASQLILLIFFLGLAMGAARYRLFEVERWWLNTWLWFGMGIAIILIDVLLITVLKLGATSSTALAVVIVAWIYFPLRQGLWQLVAHTPNRTPWQIMPEIASRFARPLSAPQVAAELASLFESIFDAPDAVVLPTPAQSDQPRLTNHGLNLVIPAPQGAGQVLLSGKHRGRQLFGREDAKYANNVLNLVGQLAALAQEYEAVERTERERIMRDLHDDVGARLLSLVHGTYDATVRDEAGDLLQTLRTSVIPLHMRGTTNLIDASSKWRVELEQRTTRASAELHWQNIFSGNPALSPRQYVNLTRILRELLTNALKHAQPDNVWIDVDTSSGLTLTFTHDGLIIDPSQWIWGRGQHNLVTRAKEINGELHFTVIGKAPNTQLEATIVVTL